MRIISGISALLFTVIVGVFGLILSTNVLTYFTNQPSWVLNLGGLLFFVLCMTVLAVILYGLADIARFLLFPRSFKK